MKPPNFRMSKDEYMEHLRRLVLAIARKRAPLSVGAVHEMANSLIVRHGIRDADKFV